MPEGVHVNELEATQGRYRSSPFHPLKLSTYTKLTSIQINSKITYTCTTFAAYQPTLSRYLSEAETEPAKLEKLVDHLERYEQNFSKNLKVLLDALNYLAATETVVFLSLCARLTLASEGGAGTMGRS